MPIKSTASPSALTSPFFKIHESYALTWEDFCKKLNGEIKGQYNAYLVEAVLKATSSKGSFQLSGHRKLTNVTTNVIPVRSRYMEETSFVQETSFSMKTSSSARHVFKIRKNTALRRLQGYKPLGTQKYFAIQTKDPNLFVEIWNQLALEDFFKEKKLSNLEYTSQGKLVAKFHHFFTSQNDLQILVDRVTDINV